ncbi:hypothetical protein D3C72_1109860 [compost metagenome]
MQIVVHQYIDIQRQALTFGSVPTVVGLNELESTVQLHQGQVSQPSNHQIEEWTTLDSYRLALKHCRTAHVLEKTSQRIQPRTQVLFTLDITAKTKVYPV